MSEKIKAIMKLADAYAESRHVNGAPCYNQQSSDARKELMSALDNQLPKYTINYDPMFAKRQVFNEPVFDDGKFTRQELQFLKSFLNVNLFYANMRSERLKKYIASVWEECDPDKKETEDMFSELNDLKNNLRQNQIHTKKLGEIQAKIKRKLGK